MAGRPLPGANWQIIPFPCAGPKDRAQALAQKEARHIAGHQQRRTKPHPYP